MFSRRFNAADIGPALQPLLGKLFALIDKGQTPEKLAENDVLMKCGYLRSEVTSACFLTSPFYHQAYSALS